MQCTLAITTANAAAETIEEEIQTNTTAAAMAGQSAT